MATGSFGAIGDKSLARRGEVQRISGLIYEETHAMLKSFLGNVISDAVTDTEHAHHKAVNAMDINYAHQIYGFGE
ncbi:hypothetical protein KP509_12G022700 [Ceratopteris richardii]|uniref:Histone H4 n=1 Tax=Ceratopteris richardii TaxID=49495 RepID=A0A8T2TMV3_CERRI|nr:hypothetical protein KP509_12G022700 [Ceratopteris richardii]